MKGEGRKKGKGHGAKKRGNVGTGTMEKKGGKREEKEKSEIEK